MTVLEALLLFSIAVPTLVIASYPVHAAVALRRARRSRPSSPVPRSVSVIVPVRGLEEQMAVNFAKLADQVTEGRLEVLFCVEAETDPAVPLLRDMISSRAHGRMRLVVAGPSGPSLGKVHNLIAGITAARAEYLVLLDSDVTLPHPRFIDELTRALDDCDVGLVTTYPAYRGARNVPAALLSATINHDLLGYFALQSVWGGLKVANGSCMALRREALTAIGGLTPLRRSLLLDSILARRIGEEGYAVHLHPEPVPLVRRRISFREWWDQAHRWQVAMSRVLSPATYAGFCWSRSAFLLALILVLVSGPGTLPATAVAAALGGRLISAILLGTRHIKDPSQAIFLWLLPAVELANAVGCLYALMDRKVVWRGRRYRVTGKGIATESAEISPP